MIRAEFCISHGDIMKIYSMTTKLDPFAVRYLQTQIERMAHHLVTGVNLEQQEGRISQNAHLVTHLHDR